MCVIVQCPLTEYDFRVTDLFVDLQDGVRLCRAIQLLQRDSSILTVVIFSCLYLYPFFVNMFSDEFPGLIFINLGVEYFLCNYNALLCQQKIVVPSDTRKKNLANCGIALQYLRQAGVSLCDEDGMIIVGDDVANGDRELTLSLLWNIFVHFQVCRSLSSVPNFHKSYIAGPFGI